MKGLFGILILSFLFAGQPCMAGYSFSESDIYKFRYDVKGEINVRPDRAVFPVVITVKAGSYINSLERANQVVADLKSEARALNKDVFSISPADFSRKTKRTSKINLSFFGGDDNKYKATTKLVSFLVVNFTDQHDFSKRSEFIAESLDFVSDFKEKYKANEQVAVYLEDSFYEIANVEQYREKIVSSVYRKAKAMAETIGKHEKVSPKIKEVYFDQYISEEILSFNKAALSISAKIEYAFK